MPAFTHPNLRVRLEPLAIYTVTADDFGRN
jgi:hypothetical protein